MPRWVLKCSNCDFIFTHSNIKDESLSDYYFPPKPEFPVQGSELDCPQCKSKATYQRTGLLYHA